MILKYTIKQLLNDLPKKDYKQTKMILCEKLNWSIYHLNRVISTPAESKAAINSDQLLIIASVFEVGVEDLLNGDANIINKNNVCAFSAQL